MRRWRRKALLASYLTTGAFLLQLGPICASSMTAGVGSGGMLIDDNGAFLGIVNVCGQENIQLVDEFGVPGALLNTEDDLMFGCPAREIVVVGGDDGGGGGGDGGGGDGGGG